MAALSACFQRLAKGLDGMNAIGWIVLAALIIEFGLHWLADRLNLEAMPESPPEAFQPLLNSRDYEQSKAYQRINTRFGWLSEGTFLAAVLIFWFAGGFPALDAWVRSFGWGPISTGLAFIGALAVLRFLLALPFSIHRTFGIEDRFGFNRTTWSTFVMDRIKGLVLACLLGGPLLAGVLFFFHAAGPMAWLYSWAAVAAYMVVVQYLAPTVILPLFNRFAPLEDSDLESAIRRYAEGIDFPLQNVFVMDGSKRSGKGNAFFTGFGRHKRIVLFDTLVAQHDRDELVAILAHEMGHYKKQHIPMGLALGILQTGLMFFLLSLCIRQPLLFEAFFMSQPSVHAGLVFFGLLYAPLELISGVLGMMLSRRHEYSADRFAVETFGKGEALASALMKLSVHHRANLAPHPFYVFLNYAHPPVLDRIKAIRRAVAGGKAAPQVVGAA